MARIRSHHGRFGPIRARTRVFESRSRKNLVAHQEDHFCSSPLEEMLSGLSSREVKKYFFDDSHISDDDD
jgi:hypothetical protein